jgi:RNA polymerase sigma-70 factor (ECF subfamily)
MNDRERDFKEIHDAYRRKVHLYLQRLAGDAEAEDLTQEVFARVSQSLHTFQGRSRLSTWIFRIATNAALDRIRNKTRSGKEIPLDDAGRAEDGYAPDEEARTLDQHVIRKEMNGCIRDVIFRLPEIYRTAIVLSELEGFTADEIAEILGISHETVKIRLHRGRAKLKEELSRKCIFYRDEWNELACELKGGFEIEDRVKPSAK